MTTTAPAEEKTLSITLLVIASVLAMSLWFVSAAIVGDMSSESNMSPGLQAALSTSVQAGFVIGAVLSALFGLADRFQPRYVFALFSLLAAVANASLLVVSPGVGAVVLRGLTGVCLAGVYPVGMKIAVGWSVRSRGLLVGLLVGGLTLGSASPHLLSFLGGTDWRLTVATASGLAAFGAVLILMTKNGPYHGSQTKFDAKVLAEVWRNAGIRRAYGGYLGHMWELYAMWAWIGVALKVSFTYQMPVDEAEQFAKLTTFVVIALGAISCPLAGLVADRVGKAELTIAVMAISGASAIAFGLTFGGNVWLTIGIAALWGMFVIPDSAQFSAIVADHSQPGNAGTLMTFQTALGFALTTVIVQLTPYIAAQTGWPVVMGSLAIGPCVGIACMWKLRRS